MSEKTILPSRENAVRANIAVHSHLANTGEYNNSPHYLPENKLYVRKILKQVLKEYSSGKPKRLIDFGCGTGFIIDLVHDLVDQIDGVDVTVDMLSKVNKSYENVTLTECVAEATPFQADTFDIASAYSFLDHVVDYEKILAEAYRVLKPGGIFYIDLNPNRSFVDSLNALSLENRSDIPALVYKEIKGALDNPQFYSERYSIEPQMLLNAEPGKSFLKGFDAEEVSSVAASLGYSQCDVYYHWFFSQGHVMHEMSVGDAEVVDRYIRMLLPHTRQLYKYVRFLLRK